MPDNLITGDCVDVMAGMEPDSIDAICTDPPYGLEFMGKSWDKISGDGWRTAGGFSKPGIGARPTQWTSYGLGDTANATCATCGGRMRGARTCACPEPVWMVKGALLTDPSRERTAKMQDWHERWAREAFRVAKPGAHLLAFGGTRTVHRLMCAIEDAGWEIRDTLVWAYSSGFPKSLNVAKAIDKAAGVEREVVGQRTLKGNAAVSTKEKGGTYVVGASFVGVKDIDVTVAATDDAKRWDGWGTALKPAWEPIVLARKPFNGTVVSNVLAHGTGALNIDGTRIGFESEADALSAVPGSTPPSDGERNSMSGPLPRTPFRRHGGGTKGSSGFVDGYEKGAGFAESTVGRWPANVILTDPILDGGWEGVVGGGTTGVSAGGNSSHVNGTEVYGQFARGLDGIDPGYGDSGTYSRFFLIAKASRSDREPVLGGLPLRDAGAFEGNADVGGNRKIGARPDLPVSQRANTHPTVKPVELMRHLVRLVTPPGGVVLDPFAGSGSTLLAAEQEGFAWIGIEKEPEYVAITEARLNGTQRGLGLDADAPLPKRQKSKSHWPAKRGPHKAEGWGFTEGQEGLLERTDDE